MEATITEEIWRRLETEKPYLMNSFMPANAPADAAQTDVWHVVYQYYKPREEDQSLRNDSNFFEFNATFLLLVLAAEGEL